MNTVNKSYNIIAVCAVIIAGSLFSSCKKYLDTTPTGNLTAGNFWQSQDDALAGVNACYATLRNGALYGQYGPQMYEILTPNGIVSGANDDTRVDNIAKGIHNSTNTATINNKWNACYEGIGRTNDVLANVPNIEMDVSTRDRVLGEANFLRALYYYQLANYYGAAPLILDPPALEQATVSRSSKDDLLKQIHADLDSAITRLPVSYSGANVGRATRGAALGLKSRIYLYQEDWVNAAATATQVMNLNAYTLIGDYRTIFLNTNENNKEVIFDVQFSLPGYANSYDINQRTFQLTAPSQDLVTAYLSVDGLPINQSPLYNSADPYANRDPRLRKTIALPGFLYANTMVTNNTFGTKAIWKKYTSYLDSVPSPDLGVNTSVTNFIVQRYAEILLNYAEAENEAVGPNANVYNALDSLRVRAGMPKVSVVNPGLGQTDMRNLIRLERRIELAGEGLYYDDIRRWKIAETVLAQPEKDISGAVRLPRAFQKDRDYLWPVPFVQIQRNPGLLPQNPGYPN
jgi:starch-binding outer membrane protein, SusD/RagB family